MENSTENTPVPEVKPEKGKKTKRVVAFIVLVLIIGGLTYLNIDSNKKHEKAMADLQLQYQQEMARLGRARGTIDSLSRVARHLEKYRGLVEAGYTRDSSRNDIPHMIGDVVKLKMDSSRVVISDIIVGGGMFEYYVRYRVIHKDRTVEEVSPEMIL